jgi:hypothetical protein
VRCQILRKVQQRLICFREALADTFITGKRFVSRNTGRTFRTSSHGEIVMSSFAKDLIELQRLCLGGSGALTQHLLREIACSLIAAGVADERGGC